MTAIIERSAAGLCYLARDGYAGMPVVLLHGIGSNAHSFAPLMQSFEQRYSLFAWNAPGYGGSSPLVPDWPDASDYASALDRLLAELDIARCVLAGHSLGALTAARFARVRRQKVTALVLMSPALGYGADEGSPLPPPVARRLEELDRLGAEKFAAGRAPNLLADPAARPDVLAEVERAMAEVRRPGYDQAARLLACGRLLDDVAGLEVPTMVLVGKQDRITPPANAREVINAMRESRPSRVYREIGNAGHAVCQEQPEAVAHFITDFVKRAVKADA
jgi:pimeloyl-ACP methyl ester carboxylesterase